MKEKETRSYKKSISSTADFSKYINGFINLSQTEGFAPTDHKLYQYLGVRPSEYENLSKGLRQDGKPWKEGMGSEDEQKVWRERDKIEAEDAVKKLVAYREDRLVRELEKSKTTSTNAIFQLKQSKNGGYQDVQQQESNSSVTIKVEGIGGLDSFK